MSKPFQSYMEYVEEQKTESSMLARDFMAIMDGAYKNRFENPNLPTPENIRRAAAKYRSKFEGMAPSRKARLLAGTNGTISGYYKYIDYMNLPPERQQAARDELQKMHDFYEGMMGEKPFRTTLSGAVAQYGVEKGLEKAGMKPIEATVNDDVKFKVDTWAELPRNPRGYKELAAQVKYTTRINEPVQVVPIFDAQDVEYLMDHLYPAGEDREIQVESGMKFVEFTSLDDTVLPVYILVSEGAIERDTSDSEVDMPKVDVIAQSLEYQISGIIGFTE